jgi:hypothetical protein
LCALLSNVRPTPLTPCDRIYARCKQKPVVQLKSL